MSTRNQQDAEYILSGKNGKIKKRIRVKVRKKKSKFSKAALKKVLIHPFTITLFILLVAVIVYLSLPTTDKGDRKWKLRGDEKTKEINKTIKETDAYE